MPSILSDEDKAIVKRAVPKPSNKIHAVAVAKLYVAYPNRSRWTYTGIQGAAVLANDLVGNTYWIKIVDVSSSNRGVIWDQEIYDTFAYNQDRTFFHTFELQDCLAGLSFADEKEAKTFKKKMDEREKNAHKATRSKAFAIGGGGGAAPVAYNDTAQEKTHHSFLGGLFSRDKHSTPSPAPVAPMAASPMVSRMPTSASHSTATSSNRDSAIDNIDPKLRRELARMGITDDQLADNFEFIQSWIAAQKKAELEEQRQSTRLPPPPPPSAGPISSRISPQNTGSTTASRRGPAPAPPPPRRGGRGEAPPPPARRASPSPQREPSPPPVSRFRAPPPLADAGKFANDAPSLPSRGRSSSNAQPVNAGPPPPPRPPKTPLESESDAGHRFAVPPPFTPAPPPRASPAPSAVPPPPSRNPVPPPLPPTSTHNLPPPTIPSLPSRGPDSAPIPPPLPPTSSRPMPPSISSNAPPPRPLPPMSNAPPPPPLPPMPSGNGPPPPPPLPGRDASGAGGPPGPPPPPLPNLGGGGGAGRGALLGDIRGGARLKKVSDRDKNDRSAALADGGGSTGGGMSGAAAGAAAGAGAGGLAGALADALAVRKSKVSHSDDEEEDDW